MSPNSMKNVRTRDFFAWCLSFCFASLAMTAAAQSQSPGPNPDSNGPVAVPPDAQAQPQSGTQPQPSQDNIWDRWRIQKVSNDDDWTRHFRIGAMVGMNISANFSMKGTISVPGNNAANGVYDDGYLHPSGNGPNTSDWGYNDPSQYNASEHTLLMHQTTSFSPSSAASSGSGDSAFVGFDMAYGGNLFYLGRARIGWELGFGLLPINISDNQSVNGNVNRNIIGFDTSGIDSVNPNPFPPAGYRGGPGGTAFLPSTPVSGVPATDQVAGTINGSYKLDVMLYTLRLGPSVYWDLNQDFGLSAGAGPAIGLVTGDYQYNETITSGGNSVPNKGQIDGTDVVYGGYVNATLVYHVPEENGDLYLGVQYMPLGDANFSGGGREGQLKLGGQIYISAGINWAF